MEIPNSIKLNDSEGNITYSCKPGYIQHGYNPKSFCENGTWTKTDIQCLPESKFLFLLFSGDKLKSIFICIMASYV